MMMNIHEKKRLVLDMLLKFGNTVLDMETQEFETFVSGQQPRRCVGFMGFQDIPLENLSAPSLPTKLELTISGCVRG